MAKNLVIPPKCKEGLRAVRSKLDALSLKLSTCEAAACSVEDFGEPHRFWQALDAFHRASADLHQTVNKLVRAAKRWNPS